MSRVPFLFPPSRIIINFYNGFSPKMLVQYKNKKRKRSSWATGARRLYSSQLVAFQSSSSFHFFFLFNDAPSVISPSSLLECASSVRDTCLLNEPPQALHLSAASLFCALIQNPLFPPSKT